MDLLWKAPEDVIRSSNLARYKGWVSERFNIPVEDYSRLYQWSLSDRESFWESLLTFFDVRYDGKYRRVCSTDPMPYVKWFEGISLNYAEHVFRNSNSEHPALIAFSENRDVKHWSWKELESRTACIQNLFHRLKLQPGDRVAAYMANIPEASAAMLACVSSGLIWSSCSPDFGTGSVVDRFQQIAPKVLFAVDGYSYNGKQFDRRDQVKEILSRIPSIQTVVWIPLLGLPMEIEGPVESLAWEALMTHHPDPLEFVRLPFDHPIWILYSSGTTGLPKAIVHGHGGMLLEHLKYLSLHNDVKPGERFFWFSTTGWMMWNFVQASLLVGATAVLYDGSPAYPDLGRLWDKAVEIGIHHFGTSAPFLVACMKAGLDRMDILEKAPLRSIGSTGSPLPPEAFEYIYKNLKKDLWLCSMSGGTDVCTAFTGSCLERPVYRGELQCRGLGVAMEAWNDAGDPVLCEMGEMVIVHPMPCMPVFFWGDPEFKHYMASYFEWHPGVWRHGDWIEITEHDGIIIYGRSDATLNRHGVRIGTAEIYNVLNALPELEDALIVNLELEGGDHFMPLFVKLKPGRVFDQALVDRIKKELREKCSPRHVPDRMVGVEEIPYTISGKKMESPVKKILMNMDLKRAFNPDAMKNPAAMQFFIANREALLRGSLGLH